MMFTTLSAGVVLLVVAFASYWWGLGPRPAPFVLAMLGILAIVATTFKARRDPKRQT